MTPEHRHDTIVATIQSVPSAGTALFANVTEHGAALVFGLALSQWSILVMILFGLLQCGYLIWKWRRDIRRENQRNRDRREAAERQ